MNNTVAAVVVTYNRKALLVDCLEALLHQTQPPTGIILVDNASTDGTPELLSERGYLDHPAVRYLRLPDNLGGAGGFHKGIEEGVGLGYDWFWLMDDDAAPCENALEQLMSRATDSSTIYGSATVDGKRLAWPVCLADDGDRFVQEWEALPEQALTYMQPFLGFLINRRLVQAIGLPDPGYFIASDDVEYCVRARAAGARVIVIKDSRIRHPRPHSYSIPVPGRALTALSLAPWKQYYVTRNRLLVARTYYGSRLFTQTIPGTFARLIGSWLREPRKLAQTWAFTAGIIDGLLARKGRLHEWWRIPQ